jgi:pseudouridine-5'-monophosphatase
MGVPGSSTGDVFHKWAQLPISRDQFNKEQKEQQRLHFPECKPLPGAKKLLRALKVARNINGAKVYIALATSSEKSNYDLKSSSPETKELLSLFDDDRRILGDDPRLDKGRGKPAPDIFLMALKCINESLDEGEVRVAPEECLVFEDSVLGVEAGRRAKMRVVWVPHQSLEAEYKDKESLVLAGRSGLLRIGDDWQLGEINDGWAIKISSLDQFPGRNFGILMTT